MFQVETEIAQRIATSLEAKLTGSETRALHAKPTARLEAHEAYLKGRYFWSKRSLDGYKQAVAHFRRAIELDPAYAQAYAGLADGLLYLGGENIPGQKETLEEARAALQKALELDDSLAEAHASRGLTAMNFDWNWLEAEQEFKRSIELDPNYATAHQWYGEFLANMGRTDEGITEIKHARALDPLSITINTDVAKVYMIGRRYDEAIEQYKKTLEMDPEFGVARGLLAITLSLAGKHDEGIAEIRALKHLETNPMYLSWLGYIYGKAGRNEEGAAALTGLEQLARQTYVSPLWLMLIETGLGHNDEAFAWFDKVAAEHASGGAIAIKTNPVFDSLRSDPRFSDVLRRANFTP
jgi:tetratricopeptide (TPR) repeat protein